MTILFFGDSITWGAWDTEGGWVARIKKFVDQKTLDSDFRFYDEVYNLGVSGDISSGVLERFESETTSRIESNQVTVFVFAFGANDCMFDIEKKVYRTRPDIFQENIINIIKKARKFTDKIIFVGLFPVNDNVQIPESWPQNEVYKNIHTSKFNEYLKQICETEKIDFIDVYREFIDKEYRNLLETDGLHPNTEGHKQISLAVLKYLQTIKAIIRY